MLNQALLSAAEETVNRVLRLDSTAVARLSRLQGKVIEVNCSAPPVQVFLLPGEQGLRLAAQWQNASDCRLQASAINLIKLLLSSDKTRVLHQPDVQLDGDSSALMTLAEILQELELDWEYQLSRWIGPVASQLLATQLRSQASWTDSSMQRLRQSLADYLGEESRSLVGQREANARFDEIDRLRQRLDRLDARIQRIAGKTGDTP
jgi:ubiquinone biosynthesis protein UbiJ